MAKDAQALKAPIVAPALREAVITELQEDGRLRVRLADRSLAPAQLVARLAVPGYRPSLGDRVLIADGDDCFLLGVLKATEGPTVTTPAGASAAVVGEQIVIRDALGRIAVTFDGATGAAEISAPAGDLRLASPGGRVILEAGLDVEVCAQRDVTQRAGRRIALAAGDAEPAVAIDRAALQVSAKTIAAKADLASLHVSAATVLAERIETTAAQAVLTVGRMEVRAQRWIERFKDAYRDVDGLLQTRAQRIRTIARDTHQMFGRRSSLISEEETSIDGKRVLLG